jgi:hypothetical protein
MFCPRHVLSYVEPCFAATPLLSSKQHKVLDKLFLLNIERLYSFVDLEISPTLLLRVSPLTHHVIPTND